MTHNTGRMQDKVVLVTGAGSVGSGWGNGRAIAACFAREGASIFGADRDPAAKARLLADMERCARLLGEHVPGEDAAARGVRAETAALVRRYAGRLVDGLAGVGLAVDVGHLWWDPSLPADFARLGSQVAEVMDAMRASAAAGGALQRL